MSKITLPQIAVFQRLSEQVGITCTEAIHVGANGRTLSAMVARGWLTERHYPNGPRVWELTPDGESHARNLLISRS